MPVKLHGRSHPVHNACKDRLPYGSRTTWMSRVEDVQGFLMSRVEGVQKFLRGHDLEGLDVKGLESVQDLGLQGC